MRKIECWYTEVLHNFYSLESGHVLTCKHHSNVLCTRVKVSDEDDYKKLEQVMGYLYGTLYTQLILGSDKSGNIYWRKDGEHSVRQDMKGHTGLVMSFGHVEALSV